jgi:hypothetical protein
MKRLAVLLFSLSMIYPLSAQTPREKARTSVAMLNYMATENLTIGMSKNNRLVLSEIRRKIINNTNPVVVDTRTQMYLNSLLQSLTSLSLATIQRDKLELIYANEKAQALSQSLPNPLYLLSMRNTNPLQLIASAALMTVDSFLRYQSASSSADFNYLLENLELAKEDIKNLNTLTDDYFNYVIDITRLYTLDKSESLNEDSIKNFSKNSLDDNLERRLKWFDDNRTLYANYSVYWLRLADTCYDLGLYERCISEIQRYESIQAPIYRNDSDFASVIPKIILSASNIHGDSITYQRLATQYLEKLLNNIIEEDWALRYFAAQAYISLAGLSNREQNLNSAYNLLVTNITYLSRKQEESINQYLKPITDDNTLQQRQRDEAKKINKELRDRRAKELPPFHSVLALHCQVIFPLMDEMKVNSAQRNQVKNILSNTLITPVSKNKYLNEDIKYSKDSFYVYGENNFLLGSLLVWVQMVGIPLDYWNGFKLTLPAIFLMPASKLFITFSTDDEIYHATDASFSVKKVTRNNNNINDFIAELQVKLDKNATLKPHQAILLTVAINTGGEICNLKFSRPAWELDFTLIDIEYQ